MRTPVFAADLSSELKTAIDRAGWSELMLVQQRSLPYLLAKQDVMVQSRTGSGKTGAFVLPILERLDPNLAACQALILVPTRELANQVAAEARLLAGDSGIRAVAIYGGVSYRPQNAAFRKGAHLVVGTPGRVIDHLVHDNFSLNQLQMLVFDEADRMLSVGFFEDMRAVQRFLPKDRHVNTAMFSATFPPYVIRLANQFLEDPAVISLSSDHVHVTEVEHIAYLVDDMEKDRILARLLEIENPISALIFCNTKMRVGYVSTVLQRSGFDVDELSGDLSQVARERVLQRIRDGKLRFLVATDVAARGIDLPDLSHVFQYEVPEHTELYIHRAGRTGRAGATGTAIMLVGILEQTRMGKIERSYDIKFHKARVPTEQTVEDIVTKRAEAHLEVLLRTARAAEFSELDAYEPMVEMMASDGGGIRALAMLIDDAYQMMVHGDDNWMAEQQRTPTQPVELNDSVMERIAVALADEMSGRDSLQLVRISRFENMAEQLAMSGDGFYILTMLVQAYHHHLTAQAGWRANQR